MVQNIDWYKGLWTEQLRSDDKKVKHFKEIDKVIEFGLELPPDLKKLKWMRNIQSTLPVEVMVVGTKVLTTIEPKFFLQPLNSNEQTIRLANEREQNLSWQFQRMDKRHKNGLIGEVVESALRYDSTANFTVPVDWQIKGQTGTIPSRYKAAMNQGGFITTVENPKNIHARYSPLGLDMVLNAKVMRARDAIYFYGEKAARLGDKILGEDGEFYVTVYDYWDYDARVTWISHPNRHAELRMPGNGWIVEKGENELPFLPWTVVEGGSSLATASDHTVRPLLGPIVHANTLELQLILQSMAYSEAAGYAAAPRAKITSLDGETVEVNFGDIQSKVVLKPTETYEILPPPTIDGNLLLIFDRIEASSNRLAGLKALADLESPSGTAFATVNAQVKVATTALDPPKKLAERALSGIAEVVLRWTAHTGDDLVGYGTKEGSIGVEYRTPAEHIDPREIYVSSTLSHHIPTDRLQQLNQVILMMKELQISFVDAAKELDIPNPEELRSRYIQEQFDNAEVAIAIKKMNAAADLEIQGAAMQMQAGFAQQVQAQQPPQLGPGGENEEAASQRRLAAANPLASSRTGAERKQAQSIAAGGPLFDPSRGSPSPNELDPGGFTKEGATGVDRGGGQI